MSILFFVMALVVFVFSSFMVSFRVQSLDRIIIFTPTELFEKSIDLVPYADSKKLYFNQMKLRNNISNYYEETLEKLLDTYGLRFYYYNPEDDSLCTSGECVAVEIEVFGTYFHNFEYDRKIKYEIKKGAAYAG